LENGSLSIIRCKREVLPLLGLLVRELVSAITRFEEIEDYEVKGKVVHA
jgi:hypothetical protein